MELVACSSVRAIIVSGKVDHFQDPDSTNQAQDQEAVVGAMLRNSVCVTGTGESL